MVTIPQLNETNDILDTDLVMVTHSNGTSEKITGAKVKSVMDDQIAGFVPQLTAVTAIQNTDVIMITDSSGNNKKLTGANLKADIVKDKIENSNQAGVSSNAVSAIITNGVIFTGPQLGNGGNIKVMFTADISGVDESTGLVINYNSSNISVKVNKNGALVDFTAVEISTSTFKYLQAYTTLELIYDGTYFVIIGNPVILSGDEYVIHADKSVEGGMIGDVKARATNNIPYGWLECNGQAISRTDYAKLFEYFNTQKYDGTNTLLSRYGTGDGSTTFNLPDYREAALVGIGQNSVNTIATHDTYTMGQYKDDQIQSHKHVGSHYNGSGNTIAYYPVSINTTKKGYDSDFIQGVSGARNGSVTRGKRKGVIYIIKVL